MAHAMHPSGTAELRERELLLGVEELGYNYYQPPYVPYCDDGSEFWMNGGINRYGDQLELVDPRYEYLDFSTQLNGVNRSATEMLSGTDFQNNDYPEPTVGGYCSTDVNLGAIPSTGVADGASISFNPDDYEGGWVPERLSSYSPQSAVQAAPPEEALARPARFVPIKPAPAKPSRAPVSKARPRPPNRSWVCQFCEQAFPHSSSRGRHEREVHGGPPRVPGRRRQ
ncbi:hypothetical protein ASPVEDRAFT_66799 [Aspergillus versicolor CBS 583.65]|uniref:C2H2-type domain-containing protein n=1 Tax=Aspergillus versicolor CBS 583.65 TaxID=1036611 RepID=A0A1L9P2R1_ASPVE|nr:uncharacterized protein ASPVEDRAFT_66799 [Aspergillus versicolor CBS 583.65]OJI95815.1 hypothetical protein ASPVEDRAFT_66799 [Aspergillus versicolor CBS 583.65]